MHTLHFAPDEYDDLIQFTEALSFRAIGHTIERYGVGWIVTYERALAWLEQEELAYMETV